MSSRDCDNMQRNCIGPSQTKSQHGEGGSGHIFTPIAEDLTPLAAGRRGSFLNGVTPWWVDHTAGQVLHTWVFEEFKLHWVDLKNRKGCHDFGWVWMWEGI